MALHKKKSKHNKGNSDYYMFGLHAVKAAIENPNRRKHELWISQNARAKIFSNTETPNIPIYNLDKSKNSPISENKVHQGAILKVSPLKQPSEIDQISSTNQPNIVVILDINLRIICVAILFLETGGTQINLRAHIYGPCNGCPT